MYNLCDNTKSNYYLKVRDVQVRLILCLIDSNRNSGGEYVQVSGNWLAGKLTCPTLLHDVGRYPTYLTVLILVFCSSLFLLRHVLTYFCLILIQTVKGLSWTSELFMREI